MKYHFLLISLSFCFFMHAQSLEFQERGNQVAFLYDEQPLSNKELRKLLKTHKASWVSYRTVQRKRQLSILVGVPSVAITGHQLGLWAGGGTPNWTTTGLGVLGTAVGVILNRNRKNKLRETVRLFNKRP